MSRVLVSPAARADLAEIWRSGVERQGKARAERYILSIRDACDALADGRRGGRPVEAVRPGYRTLSVGPHVLFFRIRDDGAIDVVRILHQRMNAGGRLEG